jgi:hypothetical protein
MKILKKSGQLFIVMLLTTPAYYSHASASDACQNVSEVTQNVTTSTCFQYVKGFLDGALLSDEQIIKNIGEDESSGFFDRAYKTRVGKIRAGAKVPNTFLADFCLPETNATNEVVMHVLEALKKIKVKSEMTEQMIYENIKREFPCARSL